MTVTEFTEEFTWVDYLVMILTLVVSLGIGIFFGCFGSKQRTDSEYLRGNKKISSGPVAISLIGGYISGITLLGTPSDIYNYGTQYSFIALGIFAMSFSVNYLFLPVFFHLNVKSSYEYLEIRFKHKAVRGLSSIIFIFDEFLTVPLYMYVPCVAIEGVTSLKRTYIGPIVMIVCVAYTSLSVFGKNMDFDQNLPKGDFSEINRTVIGFVSGKRTPPCKIVITDNDTATIHYFRIRICRVGGIKAVIWTDALQIALFLASLVILFIIGTVKVGGFAPVFETASRGGRLIFDNFNPNPLDRMTFWGSLIGGYWYWTGFNSINQTCVQRYISVPSLKSAQVAVWWFTAGCIFVVTFCVYIGLLAYTFYEGCDPFRYKKIQSAQLIPLLVSDLEGKYYGLPGLFMAGVFSAALSSISASINSTGAVLLDDFYRGMFRRQLDDFKGGIFAKVASAVFGFLCVLIMLIIQPLDSIIEMSVSLTSIACGTQFGIFSMGMINPWATYQGTLIGGIVGVSFMFWVSLGRAIMSNRGLLNYTKLSRSVDKCPPPLPTLPPEPTMAPGINPIYRISFMWDALLGWFIVMVIGSLVSLVWGKRSSLDDADPEHFVPPIANYLKRRKATKTPGDATNKGVPLPAVAGQSETTQKEEKNK